MPRTRQLTYAEIAHERRLESDRRRAATYRQKAEQAGRPSPGAADRAILRAISELWESQIAAAGQDIVARQKAMSAGVNLLVVGSRAVAILSEGGRADVAQARMMVLRRMRPEPSRRGRRNVIVSEGVTDPS